MNSIKKWFNKKYGWVIKVYTSELNFIWSVYIIKKFENLEKDRIKYLEKSLSAQKDRNSKLYKHLKLILKRNKCY